MSPTVPGMFSRPGARARTSRGASLRTRLLLLVVACILPLFAFGFGNAYFDYQADIGIAGQQALDMTRMLALLVQRDLEARLATLQVLALSDTLQSGDIIGFRAKAEAVIARQMPGSSILLLREDGQQVMNTLLPPDAPLPARRDTATLRQVFATAQPSVTDVFIGMTTHHPVVALDVPVLDADGRVIYSLALNPSVNVFAEIVHRQQLNAGWIVSILDRQNVIIARTPRDAEFVGRKAGPAALSYLSSHPQGIFENISQEGIPLVTAFSPVPVFGWSVVIGLPRADLIYTAKRAALITFGVGTACLLLGLGTARVMARRIARPIASLREISVALEQGYHGIVAATGLAATDEVAKALVAASCQRHLAERASRRSEHEREQAAALLRTVIETAPSLIYAKDLEGRMVLANSAFLAIVGKTWAEVAGRTDIEFRDSHPEAQAAMATDRRIMAAGQTEASEETTDSNCNQPRVWLAIKAPLRDAANGVVGLVGVSVEITDRKHVEDRLRHMVDELNHRVKNTLATVQSIAAHTLRDADRTVRGTLEARLLALASVHDLLTREGWQGAAIEHVIQAALLASAGTWDGKGPGDDDGPGDDGDDRLQVSGPPLRLQPRVAVALAMGVHELATNALRHGAWSVGGGQVEIRWDVADGPPSRLHMIWSERNGPPVTPPLRRGFGTRLIERSLAQDLGGTTQITFAPDGATCAIDAPLADMAATAEVMVFPQVGNITRVGNMKGHHE